MPSKELLRIVDSMMPEDILTVYRQDIPFINHKIEEAQKMYSKCFYANRSERYFFDPIEYGRKDGLNIVLQCLDKSNKYPSKERLGILSYMWFNYRGGISFLRIFWDQKFGFIYYFYTSHFVDRYRERFLKNPTISKTEAFNLFLRYNTKKAVKAVPCEKYPNNGWMITQDGLCFVEVKPNSL
jgi:hypothetical protein